MAKTISSKHLGELSYTMTLMCQQRHATSHCFLQTKKGVGEERNSKNKLLNSAASFGDCHC